ncbi:MAG: hypothetical protein HN783_09900, partial [Ilumatobacter sp.]|nr:hypothetical protein [Ilumatobacter sp.]
MDSAAVIAALGGTDGQLQSSDILGDSPTAAQVTAFSNADADGDGKLDPAGYEVKTGTSTASIYLTYDGAQRIGASVRSAEFQLASFVYAIGSFSFQKGPTHKVDIGTGFPANLGDAIGTVLQGVITGLPTAPPAGSDQLWIAPDLSKIYNLEVDSMQIGASNVHVFTGIDGPYLQDTNKDGVIDAADDAAREDALGVAINNVTFGMVTMVPTLNSLPGFEGVLPEFTALRATADSAKLVGFGSILTAELNDIVVEVNNGEEWPGDIGPPVIDFSTSFATDEVTTYFGGSDNIITVAEVRALAGASVLAGRASSDILDSAAVIAALGGTDGQLQSRDILGGSPTAAQVTAFSNADADGDDKLDPAGYEVRTGTSTAPVYLTYDGAQRIGASVSKAELKVSQFYHLVGSLSFEKGPTHKVDISTGLSDTTRTLLDTAGLLLPTQDPGNDTLWYENRYSAIRNFEVDSLQLGGSGLHLFYGLDGPYWDDLDRDGKISWAQPDRTSLTNADGTPKATVTIDGRQYGDLNGDSVVDPDETAELDEDAVGLVASNIDFGLVEMNPTLSALPGLGDILPKFQAATGSADSAGFVGMDDVVMDLEGIQVNYNDGTEWQNGEGPPVVDFSTSFDDDEVVDFFAGTDADSLTVGDVRTVLGLGTRGAVTGLFGATTASTLILKSTDVIAALGGSDGQLQINEVLADDATAIQIAAAWAADDDGDGKLDPAGYEVRTGTGTAPVYLTFDGNQRIGASAEWVTVQLAEFVHIEGSIAFEMGPAINNVRVADGFLSDLGATAGDFLKGIGLPATIVNNYPLFSSDTPNPTTDVSVMTVGAANVHAFIGFDGPYWTDHDGDREISWALPNGTTLTNADGTPQATRTVGGVRYGDLNGNGVVDPGETAELDSEAAGLAIEEFDFGMAIMTPLDAVDPSKYYSVSASADSVSLVGIDDVTAEATMLKVDVNMSSPSFKGLSLFSVIDFARTPEFASEQVALFGGSDGLLTYGDLVTLNNALPTTSRFAGITAIAEADYSKPVDHDMLVEILESKKAKSERDGVIDISEAAALLGGTNAAVTAAQTADKDGDSKIDPIGYEVGTGGVPVYLAMDGPIIRAQGFVNLNLLDTVYVSGSVAFEWGGTEEVTLTDGTETTAATEKTVTTMTIGAANVSGFVGSGGPYWTDLDGDQEVSWTDVNGNPTSTDTNSDGVVDANETSELNSDSVGFEVTDLDVGVMLGASIIPADLGIYLAGKLSVNSFGLVGIDSLTATGAFDVALNAGLGVEGLAGIDFDATYSELRGLFDAIDGDDDGEISTTEFQSAFGTPILQSVSSPEQLVDFLKIQRFVAIDSGTTTGNNGIIEAAELSAVLTGTYSGSSVTTVEQLVRALNVGGAPQTTDLTYLRTVLSATFIAGLDTAAGSPAGQDGLNAIDTDGDGKLDRGFEVNTGNPDAPVVLDFEELLIRVQLGGIIELEDVFRMNGVFLFEVQGGDAPRLSAFAAGNLEFGPDIGASASDKIFNMSALGALVLNSDGIAADISVSVSVGGALSSVLRLEASARLVINTTGKDQSITIPQQFVRFLSGTDPLTALPPSLTIDTTSEDSGIAGLTGSAALGDRFKVVNGVTTFTIDGGAPRLDGTTDPDGAYIFISISGDLRILNTFVIAGSLQLKISTTGLELAFSGTLDIGIAKVTVAGGALIEGPKYDSNGVLTEAGFFAARITFTVDFSILSSVAGGIRFTGGATAEINSSSLAKTVAGQQILPNTYRVTIHGATPADKATLSFFGVLSATGTVTIGVVNSAFVIDVDASMSFFGLATLNVAGNMYVRGDDVTFRLSGSARVDFSSSGFGVGAGLSATLTESSISGSGDASIKLFGKDFDVASAKFTLNWGNPSFKIRADALSIAYVEITVTLNPVSLSVTGGISLFEAIAKVAKVIGKAVVAAAKAVAAAATAAVKFIGGVISDIGKAFANIAGAIGSFFSGVKHTHERVAVTPQFQYSTSGVVGTGDQRIFLGGTLTISNSEATQISVTKSGNDLIIDAPDFDKSVVVAQRVRHEKTWIFGSWERKGVDRQEFATLKFSNQQKIVNGAAASQIVIVGTNSNETITLGDDVNIATTVSGRGGDDVIITAGGDDVVDGGPGHDTIFTKGGNDTLTGGGEDDKLLGGLGNDTYAGGAGNDLLTENHERDNPGVETAETNIMDGGAGNDQILGSPGVDTITGGAGDDLLAGFAHNDIYIFDDDFGTDQFIDFDGEAYDDDYEATYTPATDDPATPEDESQDPLLGHWDRGGPLKNRTGQETLDFSRVSASLSFTISDDGFTAAAGDNELSFTNFVDDDSPDFAWIKVLRTGSGGDTTAITALPTHRLDVSDAGGNDTYDFDLDEADAAQSNLRVHITKDSTTTSSDQIDLDVDSTDTPNSTPTNSTQHDIYLHPLEVRLNNLHVTFDAGIETLNLTDDAAATTITTRPNDSPSMPNGGPDKLLVKDGVTIKSSTGGDIELLARGDFTLEAKAHVETTGDVTIRGDHLTDGIVGTTIDLLGTIRADRVAVRGNAGNDTVNVTNVLSLAETTVSAGAGNDIVNVATQTPASEAGETVNRIAALLTINGDANSDTLNVDDSGDTAANTGSLTSTAITGVFATGGSINYGTLETLNINLGSAGDTFTIRSTHAGSTTLNTQGGADTIHVQASAGVTTLNGGDGADTINVGSGAPSSGGNADGVNGHLAINGDANDDALNVDDSGDSTGDRGSLTSSRIEQIFGVGGSITYATFEDLQIDLGTGDDTFTIESTHGSPTTVSAGAGDDRIIANSNAATLTLNGDQNDDTIDLNGTGAEVTINAGADTDTVNINGVSHRLTVNGQAGADTINAKQTAASSNSTLNGDAGNDVFNVLAMNGPVSIRGGADSDTVNVSNVAPRLSAGIRTVPTGTIDNINAKLTVDGGDDTGDVLNVDDSAAPTDNKTGTLTNATLGDLQLEQDIAYTGLAELHIWLGAGANTFDINSTHSTQTTLYAAAGTDTVNVNDASGRLTINAEQGDDVINVRATRPASTVVINGHEGVDTINVSDLSPSKPASLTETVGSIDAIDGKVEINGGADTDTINVDNSADSNDRAGSLSATTLRGLGLPAGVDYTGAEDLNLWLGTGADVLFIDSTHTGTTQIHGGDGNATTNERDDTIAINSIAGVTTIHGMAGNDFVEVGVDAPVRPQNSEFESPDPITGFFVRTHENGLAATLNLHGEGGSDHYTLNFAGTGTAVVNVHDNGAP